MGELDRPDRPTWPVPPQWDPGSTGLGGDAEDEVSLRDILAVLRRQARLILSVTAIVVAGAAALVFLQDPDYRATAVIRLKDARRALTGGLETAIAEEVIGRTSDPLLSQIQVLRSRTVAGAVVDSLGLRLRLESGRLPFGLLRDVQVDASAPEDTLVLRLAPDGVSVEHRGATIPARYGQPVALGGLRFVVPEPPEGTDEVTLHVVPREEAIDWVLERLRARPRDRTDVIEVQFTYPDPVVAQQLANAVVHAYQAQDMAAARELSRRRRVFIESQLQYMDSLLADAQAELSAFRSRQKLFSSRERLIAEQAGLMAVEVRREELDAQRRMYEDLLAAVERAEPGKEREAFSALVLSPEMAGNPIVEQLFTQLAQYEAKRDSLTSGVWARAPTDPDVIRLDSLIASTRAKLVTAARSHVTSLEARIDALDQLKARQAATLAALPSTETEEARLVLRVETLAKLAEQLREEYQRAQVAEAVGVGQVEIIDLAPVPMRPVGAGPVTKLSLGFILGLILGCGTAFVRENLNNKIHRRDEVETLLRVPGLAVVPSFETNGAGKVGRFLPLPHRNGNGRRATPGGVRELVMLSQPGSVTAEAYRTLRTNLVFAQAVRQVRRLVVTSSEPSEGKTTTCANLAVAFAQAGLQVLLMDCDLRRGRLHRVFDLPREPGVTELLVGLEAEPDDIVRPVAKVDGLFLLPTGKLPPNPAELVAGRAMRDLLDRLSDTYDMVIMDTPPLLAAADAATLGVMSDGVVLVIRAGQTEREIAQSVTQNLMSVGARVIGAVLNDPDGKVERYGYRHYAYYGQEGEA